MEKSLLRSTLFAILLLMTLVGTVAAQREYHLEHEWAKIWINQNGSINLLYDINITLDSGPSIDFVNLGQPGRYFTIGTAMDQYGHTLVASDASSGSDYKVKVNLYEPLMAGQTVRFNLTTNVARMIYEDAQNPGNVGMQFTPTWWEEASVHDLRVLVVLPPWVTVANVTTSVPWDTTFTEDERLAIYWERQNLSPNQKYTFGVSFPEEFIQKNVSGIYILADGNIDPPTVNITSLDNFTYTFTGNINDFIVVERDNVVIDGAGYTIQGIGDPWDPDSKGLSLSERNNVTIKNTEITGFFSGIWLNMSSNNNIYGNQVTDNNGFGVYLRWSSNSNVVSGNNIASNGLGGVHLFRSSNNTISGNNVTDSLASGVGLETWCSNNTIFGNKITDNQVGVWFIRSSNNTVSGNKITRNDYGILLGLNCSSNTIVENNIANNSNWGIQLFQSSENTIYHNSFVGNTPQVDIPTSGHTNSWDDEAGKGNYWSDYEETYPNATEIDNSGIWDTPYVIDENNQDNYPIVPEFPKGTSMLHLLIVLTIAVVIYKRRLLKTPIH